MRITNRMLVDNLLKNLTGNLERMSVYQEQLATGKQFSAPSDNPIGVARSLSLRAVLKDQEQYVKNTDDALAWLDTTDLALSNATGILQKARELAVSGANDTMTQEARDDLAIEVQELLEETINIGNSSYGGRYIFGGYMTTAQPFIAVGSPTTSVTYNGDAGNIAYEIDRGINVSVNIPGSDVFEGAQNIFQSLIDLRDDLQAGNISNVSSDIGKFDAAMDQVLNQRATVGARMNRLEVSKDRISESTVRLTELLSQTEDVDMAEAILKLKSEENVYQSALAVGTRIIQPSLLDFLS
jgi:flagellar hook-associated protein 3 FlgL